MGQFTDMVSGGKDSAPETAEQHDAAAAEFGDRAAACFAGDYKERFAAELAAQGHGR